MPYLAFLGKVLISKFQHCPEVFSLLIDLYYTFKKTKTKKNNQNWN